MTMPPWSLLRLRVRLLLLQPGWAHGCVAVLALLASLAWLRVVPDAAARLAQARQALAQARAAQVAPLPAPAPSPGAANDDRMARFYQVLGARAEAEEQVAALFAIAEKNKLALQQADYKLSHDGAGKFSTYRIVLPLKGSFAAIQQFSEEALLTVPFASLDQLSLRRDGIGNSVVEGQLSFTLYLAPAPAGGEHTDGSAGE